MSPVEDVNMNETNQELTLTPASFYREKRAERNKTKLIQLPSGVVVEVRRPDIFKLISRGVIPADLAVAAQAMATSGAAKLDGKAFENYLKLQNVLAIASVVTPEVKEGDVTDEEYERGIISADDLTFEDKEFIAEYINKGSADLDSFRDKE